MRSSPEAKGRGFRRRNVQKSRQAGSELELGEDGLLPGRRRRRRREGKEPDWTGLARC